MYIHITKNFKFSLLICASIFSSSSVLANENESDFLIPLSLEMAVKAAQQNDPWLVGNKYRQDAIESMSIAADTLPDPRVLLGVANVAADTFDFDQEAMTQFKVGISQMFPRGDSLAIKRKQLEIVGRQFPFQRLDRKAKVEVIVSHLWLDAYKAQESIALIEKDRALFEQLADVAQASYSSAVGKTRQQDIVRAQLELTRLDDRLTVLKQIREMSLMQLSEWLSEYSGGEKTDRHITMLSSGADLRLSGKLPDIRMLAESLFISDTKVIPQKLFGILAKHPAVKVLDKKIEASNTGINLVKQKYKPEWGISAGYGVRNDSHNGMDRADLFSIGVTFDIPLFTHNRQDKQVQSAISKSSAVKTEKWLLIRKLIASFETSRAQLIRLNQRKRLYQERLLPQMHDQAEASLTAYTNDDGDFSEVVRSRIAELNAAIDALSINVERQKSIVQLNYFFIKAADDVFISRAQEVSDLGDKQ